MDWSGLKKIKKNLDELLLMGIHGELIFRLETLCQEINSDLEIVKDNCPKSSHHTGHAIDVMFPSYEGSLIGLYLVAERLNFSHIGLYPDWDRLGHGIGGLHLETTPLKAGESGKRWIGVDHFDYGKIKEGKAQRETKFIGLTIRNMKRLRLMR